MRNAPTLPLLDRSPDGLLMCAKGQTIDGHRFLCDVLHFADMLPKGGHAINLTRDRYVFLVSFCAVLVRGGCNVLPPNMQTRVITDIARGIKAPYIIHDGEDTVSTVPSFLVDLTQEFTACEELPRIAAQQLACISYTSGSTGSSSAIPKSWKMLLEGARINRQFVLSEPTLPTSLVATVPSQHMYGLETAILLPLVTDLCVHSSRPVFPMDVATALQDLPAPRVLVSTPLHLRALAESQVKFPAIGRIVSATAPLTAELASQIEQELAAPLLDIYGCSEVGCMAFREVARDDAWQPFLPFRFQQDEEGFTCVNADHMDEEIQLQDRFVFDETNRFQLTGRMGDHINVGGKRASLSELTRLLLAAPGVTDGLVFEPPGEARVQRLAAVYAGDSNSADVLAYMRQQLDPVLLPRPLIHLEQLPRNETGKLTRDALISLYHSRRNA